jgi:hypothetical protein
MSEHAWTLENLAVYLAGGLESAERERLEQHTADCPPCAAALAAARALDTSLTGLFAESRPSAALEDRLVQALRTRTARGGLSFPVPGWLAVAAAALLLIGATGVVASQLLDPASLAFPHVRSENQLRQVALSAHVEGATRDVEELARQSRESAIGQLQAHEPTAAFDSTTYGYGTKPTGDEVGGGQGRNPRMSPPISDGISNTTAQGQKEPEKSTPMRPADPKPAAPPAFNFYMGYMGSGGGTGSGGMGIMGGGAAPPAGMGPNPYLYMDGSVAGTKTPPPVGYSYTPPSTATPPPAPPPGEPAKPGEAGAGAKPGYFAPSNLQAEASKERHHGELGAPKGELPPPKEGDQKGNNGRGGAAKGASDDNQGQRDHGSKEGGQKPPAKVEAQPAPRKIVIRTGEVEYEVASFDAAVATITRLVKPIKGGFIATVNSDKLANGKVRGSVVLRVPPENLDDLILELRTNLGKSGELKNQRIGSQDITKQYTDLESRLKAARAMEERLLQIIKSGKGEIKDLLAVEKELGTWRTRIEEIEGELRYYANQVALSTLTITLFEKEIQAPFGIVETERVQMGLEVEEVDQAMQAAQKAVREVKGRITRSEMKQHSAGQFSAILNFEVTPDAAGPMRDRLRQLGTVARLDIDRVEQTEGGTGKPTDGKTTRRDTQFFVSFYNLTNVAPRETVQINVATVEVEAALKTLLARIEKAAGRVLSSSLNSARSDQTTADLQFEVKSAEADAVLADVKAAGEVMRLIVAENPDTQNTTRKKRGFHVQLWALGAVAPRETDVIQIASADVPAAYRTVQDAVIKAKGRMLNAQLNEQDRQNVTATLDFEVRRTEEAGLRAALASAGDIYTRTVNRAPDAENVLDSKVRWQVTLINQAKIPPRETYVFGVEVNDVDQTATVLSALVSERQGRTADANISRERSGRVTAKLVYDVPLAKVHELLDQLRAAGTVRVQQSVKHPEVPDSALAIARLDVTLSNKELIVPTDEGLGTSIRSGLSDSFKVLAWSLRILIFGLSIVLPWALVIWAIYRLVVRLRRRPAPAVPAA